MSMTLVLDAVAVAAEEQVKMALVACLLGCTRAAGSQIRMQYDSNGNSSGKSSNNSSGSAKGNWEGGTLRWRQLRDLCQSSCTEQHICLLPQFTIAATPALIVAGIAGACGASGGCAGA